MKPESSTGPLLEESIWIILDPGLQCLLRGADTTPIVLSEVRIVHEEWPINIRQQSLVNVVADNVVKARVEILIGSIDLGIVCCKSIGEVQLNDNIVLICGEVEKILAGC
jgi:hypothetical protein